MITVKKIIGEGKKSVIVINKRDVKTAVARNTLRRRIRAIIQPLERDVVHFFIVVKGDESKASFQSLYKIIKEQIDRREG